MTASPTRSSCDPTDRDLDAELVAIADEVRPLAHEGSVADYLPGLSKFSPDQFGLAVCELDGRDHVVGDVDVPFPIQSISKVFALTLAAQILGDAVWQRVGREPSGDPFNSLVQLEHERGVPRNPMINAGALVIDDLLVSHCADPRGAIEALVTELVGEPIGRDDDVLRAKSASGHRNRAMAHLMKAFGNFVGEVEDVIAVYVHQCALTLTARQLARASRFLANGGVDPRTGRAIVPAPLARRINAVMLTCGTYDAAGDFAFRVGLPCKSGVSGAIMGDVPRRLGVCVWSPPLDPTGNSRAGTEALHLLAERLELSVF